MILVRTLIKAVKAAHPNHIVVGVPPEPQELISVCRLALLWLTRRCAQVMVGQSFILNQERYLSDTQYQGGRIGMLIPVWTYRMNLHRHQ